MRDPAPEHARESEIPRDGFAKSLGGFGPLGILAMLVILLVGNGLVVPVAALLVLAWVRVTHTPWRDIGYVRPRSWTLTVAGGIVAGIAFKLLMKAVVMPLFGADPVNHAFHYLAGNRAALPGAVYAMIVSAGFGEETVFRGYLFERLGKLFGSGRRGNVLVVLSSSVLFGLAHYTSQGWTGVEQAMVTGLVFGSIRAVTGKLPFNMVAHAAFDLTAVAIIYLDLETSIAHLVFR